jgi:ABC-2 type transport system ATP-binding protein
VDTAPAGPLVDVRAASKSYVRRITDPGIAGAIKGIFHRRKEVVRAVTEATFSVREGEVVGFIGPNGAGKSTTIKMLCGVLLPDGGEVRLEGRDPFNERRLVAPRIAVVFGQRNQLWNDLPVRDTFALHRHVYRIPDGEYRDRVAFLRERLELTEFWDAPVRQLSLGQRMRSNLALALLHSPRILLLDEPTIGMDVLIKSRFRELLKELNRSLRLTIILTTHDLADVEQLCERALIMDHGRLIYDGELAALRKRHGSLRRVVADLATPAEPPPLPAGASLTEATPVRLTIDYDPALIATPALVALLTGACAVKDLTIAERSIEDVIKGIYESMAGPRR